MAVVPSLKRIAILALMFASLVSETQGHCDGSHSATAAAAAIFASSAFCLVLSTMDVSGSEGAYVRHYRFPCVSERTASQ